MAGNSTRAQLVAGWHSMIQRLFGKLGSSLANTTVSYVFFIVGLIVFAILTAGVYKAEKAASINDLWIPEGTRLEDERNYFNSVFGGLARSELLQIINRDTGVVTDAALSLQIAGLEKLTKEGEPGQLSQNVTNSGGVDQIITEKDICSRPEVPTAWAYVEPGAYTLGFAIKAEVLVGATGAYLATEAGEVSLGFQRMSECVETNTGGAITALDPGWGIKRFPCTRLTPLDCFQEGGFDYPAEMAELYTRAPAYTTVPSIWAACLDSETTRLVNDVTAVAASAMIPVDAAALQTAAEALFNATDASLSSFVGMGYWWRPSFTALTDEQQFQHVDAAITNLLNPAITTEACIGGRAVAPAVMPTVSCCVAWSGTKVPAELYLGYIDTNSAGERTRIGATQVVLNNENELNPEFQKRWNTDLGFTGASAGGAWDSDRLESFLDSWELRIVDLWAALTVPDGFTVNYAVSRSNSDIVRDGAETEGGLIVIGYVIMFVFIVATFGNFKCPCNSRTMVDSHLMLGLGGLLTIALSTFCSFGLTSWFEVALTPVNINVVPFLSLGLGLDDMLVLAHTVTHLEKQGTIAQRMAHTFSLAGPSVFLTSFCNFLAFIITSVTPLPVIRAFGYQMAISVFLNFMFLILLFGPMMAWNLQRVSQGRADILLTRVGPTADADTNTGAYVDDEVELAAKAVESDTSLLTVFSRKYYAPALKNACVKVFVLLAFAALAIGLGYNALENTELGIRPSDIALDGSYQSDFLKVQEVDFPAYSSYVVSRSNITQETAQRDLMQVLENMQKVGAGVAQSLRIADSSWLSSLLAFAPDEAKTSDGKAILEDQFYTQFHGWVTTSGATSLSDLACRARDTGVRTTCADLAADNMELFTTRVSLVQANQIETDFVVDSIHLERQVADLWNDLEPTVNDNFVTGYIFFYWSQYIHIEHNLYTIAAYSLLGVFLGMLLFQANLNLALLISFVILMIDLEIYGIIDVVDAKLNGFSMGNLVMSVGLSVEFCAHIARSFHVAHGDSLNDRMELALNEMFAPVTYGALSSFLPILPLAFAEFPFFRTYYFNMFSFMILFAYANGIILLPVLLSLIGPESLTTTPPHAAAPSTPSNKGAAPAGEIEMKMGAGSGTVVVSPAPQGDTKADVPTDVPVTAV